MYIKHQIPKGIISKKKEDQRKEALPQKKESKINNDEM